MTAKEFSGIDFDLALGEVYGLRAWKLDPVGRLRALHVDGVPPWRPGVNVAACHRAEADAFARWGSLFHFANGGIISPLAGPIPDLKKSKPEPHSVPTEDCRCGFYAYTDLGHEENRADSTNKYVLGVIRGTGRTLIGTKGFRCEKAEIVALLDPTRGGLRLNRWRREQRKQLRYAYPEVPLLLTRRELVRFAPIEQTLPSPADEQFWTVP